MLRVGTELGLQDYHARMHVEPGWPWPVIWVKHVDASAKDRCKCI